MDKSHHGNICARVYMMTIPRLEVILQGHPSQGDGRGGGGGDPC